MTEKAARAWTIRPPRPAEVPALTALKLATFREAFLEDFAIPYPPADLAVFEAESYSEATVARELADPAHQTWVVESADAPGALIAYAHIGPCKLPHPEVQPGDAELYQIYLRRSAQGSGLGKALLELVLAAMARISRQQWLGVWSGNARALAFYQARGFEIVGEYRFKVGNWYDDERIMRRIPAGPG